MFGDCRSKPICGAAVFLFLSALPTWADTKTQVDLDGIPPQELLTTNDEGSQVHFWSAQNELWIEVFSTEGVVEGFSEDPQSSLSRIKSGGRFWQWRNDAYVPLVAEEPIFEGPLSDEDLAAAVQFIGDYDTVPANSVANTLVRIETGGRVDKIALLGGSVFCSLGGTNCPLVAFIGGKPSGIAYVSINLPWGFSSEVGSNGFPVLEVQQEKSIILKDMETGAETVIDGLPPVRSEPQQQMPRDFE